MVNHLDFRQFFRDLNSDFEMISRCTLRTDILKMFHNGKSTLKKLLEVNQDRGTMALICGRLLIRSRDMWM